MPETIQPVKPQPHRSLASPAYQRIEDDLRARIREGRWAAGVMLPSRRHLATEYGVSLPTLERAIADLLADGTLKTQGRKGTVIAENAAQGKPAAPRAGLLERTPVAASPLRAATIGIVSALLPAGDTNLEASWKSIIISALERAVTETGGSARFCDINTFGAAPITPVQAMMMLRAEGVDAVAFVFEDNTEKINEVMAQAQKDSTPIVFVFSRAIRQPVPSVYYDSRDAGFHAASHLLQRGCRSLQFFAPYTTDWVMQRLVGAREAVLLAGLPAEALSVQVPEQELGPYDPAFSHEEAAYAAARRLRTQEISGQGVIAANDKIAFGFMRAAQERGLTAGKEYALVGFDDEPRSRALGLTTLHPPLEALGQEAGLLLLRALSGEKARRVCLHSHLIARASTAFFPSHLAVSGATQEMTHAAP